MRSLVLIVHNVRSCHNVGSLLRTAEGLGVEIVYLTGYTPYPSHASDRRLPHLADKIDRQIHKTALGAEHLIKWQHQQAIKPVITKLKHQGYTVMALEQAPKSQPLPDFRPPERLAVIVGREVGGLESSVIVQTDGCLEIPMLGRKESFNVAQAAAIALYHVKFIAKNK